MSPITNSPIENWDGLSDRELIARMLFEGGPQSPQQIAASRLLDVRFAERAGQENAKLVQVTQDLVDATRRLGTITAWLVAGTFLLGLAATLDVLMKLLHRAY
jgi:hypothetical protein